VFVGGVRLGVWGVVLVVCLCVAGIVLCQCVCVTCWYFLHLGRCACVPWQSDAAGPLRRNGFRRQYIYIYLFIHLKINSMGQTPFVTFAHVCFSLRTACACSVATGCGSTVTTKRIPTTIYMFIYLSI